MRDILSVSKQIEKNKLQTTELIIVQYVISGRVLLLLLF